MEETKTTSEENNNKACCNKLDCGHCCHKGCRYAILRWLLGLLILALVFAVGVKVGEFKEMFKGYGKGYYNNMGNRCWMQRGGQYAPMFRIFPDQEQSQPQATTTPSKATTTKTSVKK